MQSNKIICVGRNYTAHINELNNAIPSEPVLFIKPATCAVNMQGDIHLVKHLGDVSYELELFLEIGEELNASSLLSENSIHKIGLALDLTLRDVQNTLKEQGLPWEKAKSFDGACPLSEGIVLTPNVNINNISIRLEKNKKHQQLGYVTDMIYPPSELIKHITHYFTLYPGDIILTGTPAGVGKLQSGDTLTSTLCHKDDILLTIDSDIK